VPLPLLTKDDAPNLQPSAHHSPLQPVAPLLSGGRGGRFGRGARRDFRENDCTPNQGEVRTATGSRETVPLPMSWILSYEQPRTVTVVLHLRPHARRRDQQRRNTRSKAPRGADGGSEVGLPNWFIVIGTNWFTLGKNRTSLAN